MYSYTVSYCHGLLSHSHHNDESMSFHLWRQSGAQDDSESGLGLNVTVSFGRNSNWNHRGIGSSFLQMKETKKER